MRQPRTERIFKWESGICHLSSAVRCVLAALLMFGATATSSVWAKSPKGVSRALTTKTAYAPDNKPNDELAALKAQVVQQQKQIEQLLMAVAAELSSGWTNLETHRTAATSSLPNLGQVASAVPMAAAAPRAADAAPAALSSAPDPGGAPAMQAGVKGYTMKVDTLSKTVEALNKGLAGFKFAEEVFASARTISSAPLTPLQARNRTSGHATGSVSTSIRQ